MLQVTAILARQEAVNEVVDKFSKLDANTIWWTLLQRSTPAHSETASVHGNRENNRAVVDALEPALQRPLLALGLDPDTRAAYARSLLNGAVVIVVRPPVGYIDEIHQLLARCDATDISLSAVSAAPTVRPTLSRPQEGPRNDRMRRP